MQGPHPRQPRLAAFAVFLLAAIAAATLIWRSEQHNRQEVRARVFNLASEHAGNLQRSIEHDLSATYALAALVRQGKGSVPNFDDVATQILPFYPGVSELALMPGVIIRDVVPLAGNEKAVGHDLLRDPAQNKEAFLARDTGKLTLAGPLDLVQGGLGAVGRLPVFLDDPAGGKPSFWGFTLVVIRFPDVLEAVDLPQLAQKGFAYELWRMHPGTGQKQVIAASSSTALIEPVERALQVPNATWTLSVAPLGGWGQPLRLWGEAVLGLLFSLLLAYLAKLLLELQAHREGLEALVERRTAEVRASEARYRDLFEANPHPMLVYDLETLIFLAVNDAAVTHYGYTRGEFGAMSILDIRPPEDVPRLLQRVAEVRKEGNRPAGIWRHRRKDGTLIDVEIASNAFDFGGRRAQIVLVTDVTDRLQAERKLRESEARFRSLTEMSSDWYWETDAEHRFTQRSSGSKDDTLLALLRESRIGLRRWEVPYLAPDESAWRQHRAVLDAHLPFRNFEISRRGADGSARHSLISGDPVFDARGEFQGYRGVGTDITERKRAQTALARRHDLYNLLSQTNQAIVRLGSRDELFPVICRNAVENGRFRFAWIGMIDAATQRVLPVAKYGEDAGYVSEVRASAEAGTAMGRGPLGQALRAGEHTISNDFLNDPAAAPWHEAALRAGVGAVATFPIRECEAVVGAICLYAVEPGYFTEDLLTTLDEMALDVSFGLTVYAREAERKQAETVLRESEERYYALTELSSDWYWEQDENLRFTRLSRPRLGKESIDFDTLVGKTRREAQEIAWDESRLAALEEIIAARRPFRDFEIGRTYRNGPRRYVQMSGEPIFDASGRFSGYRGIGKDVTERKEREEDLRRFRAAMDATEDAIYLVDRASLGFIDVNAAACAALELAREEILALGPEGVLSIPREELARIYDSVIASGTAAKPVEMRRRRKSGKEVWIEIRRHAQRSGESWLIVTVARDITERKRREEELRLLNEKLEQRVEERTQALEAANRELEAFSYSVSHDLRAPLRAIGGFSRQVIDRYAGHIDEQGRDMLRRVSAGAERMGHLIDDLIKLSRISRQAIQIEPVDLSALARELAGELQAEAPERKVEWVIAPHVTAVGDPGLLRVALQNLLGNAWKYSSRRELARIDFGVGEKNGRTAYFVRDNGAGFDMAHAQKLFGAFQRLHSEAEFPGTGIGLATVARVIHRHGGEVWAEGWVGEGAVFRFSLDRVGGGGSSSAAATTGTNTPAGL